ncbi:hypothetical protein BTA51_00685 [Hahella sp. CCB-MM4]|uniref:hypothetical protein n=1 Tax=Hahella sp. (strain CCB-MM4) TaxID=1926491 RepID=UPI000B9B8291|nr:hypothetical protein [Hahella sp. CCB-MM4]OZG74953.1 hypothetical protein BTA51_00685 [Hahella sp. CCB-MM4]
MTDLTQSRRQFLRLSLLTPFAISASSAYLNGCAATTSQPAKPDSPAQYYFLDEEAADFWRAVLAVIVSREFHPSTLSNEEIERSIARIDDGIRHFSPANREKMGDLFNILSITLTRGLTTGVWRSWPNADNDDIRAFLDSWRDSSFQTFNQGFIALVQLGALTYYGASENWAKSGYPGPPQALKDALPQFNQEVAG